MPKVVSGARAVQDVISRIFKEKDTLVTLYYGDTVVSQYMTTIDDLEAEYVTDDLSNGEVDLPGQDGRDDRVRSITLFGELIEAAEAHGRAYSTEVTLLVEEEGPLTATIDGAQVTVWSGGEWVLVLHRLHEPLRHRTHELVARGDVLRVDEEDDDDEDD